jgi:hypothetical protein
MGFFGSKKLSAEDHERSITLARRLSRMNEADLLRKLQQQRPSEVKIIRCHPPSVSFFHGFCSFAPITT